jgi:hypothetical protein
MKKNSETLSIAVFSPMEGIKTIAESFKNAKPNSNQVRFFIVNL